MLEAPDDQSVYWSADKNDDDPPRCDLLCLDSGQLALMTGQAAKKSKLTFGVLGARTTDPARQIADVFYIGDVKDGRYFEVPLANSDAVTIDNEHINARFWENYQGPSRLLFPGKSLYLTQNKKLQHQFLRDQGLPLPEFADQIETFADLKRAARKFGYQGVLQTGSAAYDGRGNALINGPDSLIPAWEKLGKRGNLFLERFVNFERELAVQVVRDNQENSVAYPPVESDHINGQLYLAQSNNHLDARTWLDSTEVAQAVSQAIPGIGLLTVELFQLRSEDLSPGQISVLINEICIGRPHNSHHHTEGASVTSQFDQIVLLAQQLPLGSVAFKPGITHSGMVNLLGSRIENILQPLRQEVIEQAFGVQIQPYGKPSLEGRKIGDIRAQGTDAQNIRDRLEGALITLNGANNNLYQYHPEVFNRYR